MSWVVSQIHASRLIMTYSEISHDSFWNQSWLILKPPSFWLRHDSFICDMTHNTKIRCVCISLTAADYLRFNLLCHAAIQPKGTPPCHVTWLVHFFFRMCHAWGRTACHTNEWVSHTYEWVCRTYEWVSLKVCLNTWHGSSISFFVSALTNNECVETYMSHVAHVTYLYMNESCHVYEWVMSHISRTFTWMSHVTYMNESCRTCHVPLHEWVMSHMETYLSCVETYGMSHKWISQWHVTYMNESA